MGQLIFNILQKDSPVQGGCSASGHRDRVAVQMQPKPLYHVVTLFFCRLCCSNSNLKFQLHVVAHWCMSAEYVSFCANMFTMTC
uniref:Uncharacterized protein n=1 Tax=Triticum urartu TaxID=4572 RepID=A0A8R7JYA5_TRIUA